MMGWRDILDLNIKPKSSGNSNPPDLGPKDSAMLNIMDPTIRRKPQLELLTEVEIEAFNGWYSTMRKPRFNLSHDEASLRAWGYLMDSMQVMYREGRGRYKPHE
jgi:hypothetical protein